MSINRVIITGNLTRDPELKATASGMSVLKLRMAVNDRRKNSQTGEWEDAPNYIDVTIFGQRGESLSRFLEKGSRIGVDGKLRWSEWENQQGEQRSKLEVIADDIEFLSSRSEGGGGGRSYSGPTEMPTNEPIAEEDIPF